ncbi:SulP family inorganic anion transporter [Propionivibrio sp.]|uniref:SulP family inorganic anion transporter n=1 Tax=Propionivibrio sp. TaxID=2212460 RepID=UPI0025D26FFA|nr:SulP family inorganic anion transporter [Propionivibrio sp.]MBK7355045.1 SulP family inorganic anion transporter [Propionivibrio sp.]
MDHKSSVIEYYRSNFGKDALASVVVFLVALPLCMGISIASGVPPTAGLITGIIGGIVVGLLAGSPLQVSGPAAGLTVLVWQIVQQYGLPMLGLIVLLAGLMQLAAGLLKLGQWFRAVSPAVIHGMLAGIGVLIFSSQFHVMLDGKPIGAGVQNLLGIPGALTYTLSAGGAALEAFGIGILTIAVIALWTNFAPKKLKALPAPLVAIVTAVLTAALLHLKIKYIPDLLKNPDDINNILSVIQYPTLESLKHVTDSGVLVAAASVAFIASAETLLCASAVDQMHQGPRTKYDKELAAQGIGNALCGLLGVLPMTGVIVRSSANVDAGGQTRSSAILHGVWLLLFVAVLPFTLAYIPVASLAGLLVFTGYKLAYPKVVPKLLHFGKTEAAIYFSTIVVIVSTDLLKGVLFGLLLSLIKLLYVFSHLEIRWDEDFISNRLNLYLKGSATLIRLPLLAAELERIRPGSEVHIHFEDLDYIDHACLDLLTNWEKQHEATGGGLVIEWEELSLKYHQRRTGAQEAVA